MTFAIWKEKPPFTFAPEDREQIYVVGAVWVVTDNPAQATQAEVDKILNPAPPPAKSVAEKLAAVGLTPDDIKTATLMQGPK